MTLICFMAIHFFMIIDTNDTFAANGLQTLLGIEEENLSSNLEVKLINQMIVFFFPHSIDLLIVIVCSVVRRVGWGG